MPGWKGDHVRGVAIVDDAFGKNEEAVAAVDGFAGEAKAFAKAGKLREREDIEERDDQEIAELPEPAFGEKPFARRMAECLQAFRRPWRWRDDGGSARESERGSGRCRRGG